MELADAVEGPKSNPANSTRGNGLPTGPIYQPRTLAAEMKVRGALPLDECLRIANALTSALAELHRHGLVHRDIKPSNLIFVNGVPKLADIGLVAAANEARSFVGTEGFIPPEGPGTPQADLYSLGIVLYVISTGKSHRDFPEPPGDLASRSDRERWLELQAIIHRACQADPRRRYANAEEISNDLERLAEGKSVRRAQQLKRHWRWVGYGIAWLAAITIVLAFIIFAVRLWRPPTLQEARKRSTNSVANDFYDIGWNLYLKNTDADLAKAAEYFQKAIDVDTNFTLAEAALSAAWSWPTSDPSDNFALLPRAKEIAERALAKDGSLSEAHLAVALHAFVKEWNFQKAEDHFRLAIRNDPENPEPFEWYGQFLHSVGRTNEGVQQLRKAVELNPRSQSGNVWLGRALLASRDYAASIVTLKKAFDLEAGPTAIYWMSKALEADGQIEEAITVLERSSVLSGNAPAEARARAAQLRHAFEVGGVPGYHQQRYEILKTENAPRTDMAEACALVGKNDEALDLLEQACRLHDWKLLLLADLKTRASWDGLRNSRRLRTLLKDMNLE